jgi:hypothetical protein
MQQERREVLHRHRARAGDRVAGLVLAGTAAAGLRVNTTNSMPCGL